MCLEEARKSLQRSDTPVGAVLVSGDEIVGKASSIAKSDETDRTTAVYHAELRLLLDNQASSNLVLYTALEPCLMCMGAIIVSRIGVVVWAVDDFWGGYSHTYNKSSSYLRQRLPQIVRTPYADLQVRGSKMWIEHLNRVGHPEYIERILKWQVRIIYE